MLNNQRNVKKWQRFLRLQANLSQRFTSFEQTSEENPSLQLILIQGNIFANNKSLHFEDS